MLVSFQICTPVHCNLFPNAADAAHEKRWCQMCLAKNQLPYLVNHNLIIINGRHLDKRFLSSDLWGFIANRAEEVALNWGLFRNGTGSASSVAVVFLLSFLPSFTRVNQCGKIAVLPWCPNMLWHLPANAESVQPFATLQPLFYECLPACLDGKNVLMLSLTVLFIASESSPWRTRPKKALCPA